MTRPSAYSESHCVDNYPPGMERHWWTQARAQIVLAAVADFKHLTMMDVGCGPGLTVEYLRNKGFDCWGCELGQPVVRRAAKDFVVTGTDVWKLNVDFRNKVGVVLLLDVLEHVPDPQTFLATLLLAFPNSMHIVVTVPARKELWSAWDERYGHYCRYNRQSLTSLLAGAGLKLSRVRYIFHSLYPALFVVSKTATRATKIREPRLIWLHWLIAWWFSIEAKILHDDRLIGTSLLAVCNRTPENYLDCC